MLVGAPPRQWIVRALLAVAAVAAVRETLTLPLPFAVRLVLVALLLGAIADQMFRWIPAFDPLRRVRWRLPKDAAPARRCALTFDDGPSASTGAVLDILKAEGVPATFFVLGEHVERFPATLQRADAEGHAIGLHGMTHAKLGGSTEASIEAQVTGVTALLRGLGVSPARIYRTPHGFKSRRVCAVARRHGLTLWAWTRGVWDTDRPNPAVLVRRATRFARPGMVLLLHDGRGDEPAPDIQSMIAALPGIIRELKRRGFAFVTVADV
jgi:peptidoglycan-N-acetylglucosamine deacetylase